MGRINELIQSCADALGYCVGAHIRSEIQAGHATRSDTGERIHFNLLYSWLELTGRDPDAPVVAELLSPVVIASVSNLYIREALADLGLAMGRPGDTAFYCYRAVESIRHWLAERDGIPADAKHSWPHLREVLGFTENELQVLARASRHRRHGDIGEVSQEERLSYLRPAREVVRRAIEANH